MYDSVPALLKAGRTMIIGSTGFIGRFIADACLDSGLPTYPLVVPRQNSPSKAATIKFLQSKGANIIHIRITSNINSYTFYHIRQYHYVSTN